MRSSDDKAEGSEPKVFQVGERVHIITRRLFEGDLRRHFVGRIVGVNGNVARVDGFSFVYDPLKNEYTRRPDRRIRIFDLAESGHIVNILPKGTVVKDISYKIEKGRLVVTDGVFSLDINEFGTRS